MDVLGTYLNASYRREVMKENVEVAMPTPDPAVVAAAKSEVDRINALGLGSNLVQRDFASFQHKRALEKLITHWNKQEEANASETRTGGSPPGDAKIQGGFASFGVEGRTVGVFPQTGNSDQPQPSGTEQINPDGSLKD